MKKKIFFSVIMGIIAFVIAFCLGSILTISTGIPLIGGLLNGVLTAMVLTVGLVANKYWGSATIMWIVFSLSASLTTTLGPPGIYKVVIGLIAGLLWDTVYSASKYKNWGLYFGGLLGSASIMFILVLFLKLGFGKEADLALEKYQRAFWFIFGINIIITFVGLYLGNVVYQKRLKDLRGFKNINK